MNVEYMKFGDRVYVTDDEGHTYIKNTNEKIEEILIKENRLEILNNLIEDASEELMDVNNILKSNRSSFKLVNLLFVLIVVGIPLLIGTVTQTASFSLTYIMMLLLPAAIGELLVIPTINFANNNLIKQQKGLEAKIEKAKIEKNKLKKELKEYKVQTSKELTKDWDLDFLIEKVRKSETKEVSDKKSILIDEYPYFVDLEEQDNGYLEQLNETLNSAYNEGEEKWLGTLEKNKRKILQRRK